MGYTTLLKYGLPALLIIALGVSVYVLKAEVKALKAEKVLLTEANTRTAQAAMDLKEARDQCVEAAGKRVAGKDRTIAEIRRICGATAKKDSGRQDGLTDVVARHAVPTGRGTDAAAGDTGDLRAVLNGMWRISD